MAELDFQFIFPKLRASVPPLKTHKYLPLYTLEATAMDCDLL